MELEDIVSRFTEEQILELFYASGCKEPSKKPKITSTGWTTIRCYGHEDSENHKEGKRASLTVNVQTGGYRCMACQRSGNLITIAKRILNTSNGKEALQFLADEAGVDLGNSGTTYQKPKPLPKPQPKPIEYVRFNREKPTAHIDIETWLPKIDSMSEVQKYKLLLTSIYRSSLKTDQSKKVSYYEGRHITNPRTQLIGFIHKGDAKFWQPIEEAFGIEMLIHFGFYQPADAKWRPLSWKYDEDVCFVPSFDLYTDLLTGAMLRPIVKPKNGAKEWALNKPSLLEPVPFALNHDVLEADEPIWITEGSVDGLSLGASRVFAAIPGVNGISDEMLGLFEGKVVVIAFDQDRAGQEAALGYTDSQGKLHEGLLHRLYKAGAVKVLVAKWNVEFGKDLNDLLKNGALNKIIVE